MEDAANVGGDREGGVRRAVGILLAAGACWWLAGQPAEAQLATTAAVSPPLSPDQVLELRTLAGQLADPTRTARTKVEAAELLLTRSYPQAADVLKAFLSDSSNRAAQVAVAEAVANQGRGSGLFVEPLLAMLTGAEPSVRTPAANALVTYKDPGVSERLIAIARDQKAEKAVRTVVISALGRVLNKSAVAALVGLMDDHDPAIRSAAAESLARMTNIRAFGGDARRWREWWANNKDKPATEWLGDLADSLARERARLEELNVQMRKRLAAAMMDLHAATPAAQQDALLLGLLKDPLGDVRLVGVTLADRKITAGGQLPEDVRMQLRAMLADPDAQVRRAVAILTPALGDPQALEAILARLRIEESPEARQGLLTALGQLRDPRGLDPILLEIASKDEPVAAAAAAALSRLVPKQPLTGALQARAAQVLLDRWADAGSSNGAGVVLREALLTAMGTVADKAFVPVMRQALKDPAATVRLAAVTGLAQLRQTDLADVLAPMVADEDRGVRQAAIDALGLLGGQKHLATILQRIEPTAEPDQTVRDKAWSVAMTILAKADADTLAQVADTLAERKDVLPQRVKVMQMLVQALKADGSPRLPEAQRKLSSALMASSRPAEAAPLLADVHESYSAARSPQTAEVFREWLDALLGSDDPGAIKVLADQKDPALWQESLRRLQLRLEDLVAKGRYAPVILLAGEAVRQLAPRLTDSERANMDRLLAAARARQLEADRQRVAQLVVQLLAPDAASRDSAGAELKAMGDRAAAPMAAELRKIVASDKPNPQAEKAVLDILAQIAPKLAGYDPAAPQAERLRIIDAWLKAP